MKRLQCCNEHSSGNRCCSDVSSGISCKIWHIYVKFCLAAKIEFSVKEFLVFKLWTNLAQCWSVTQKSNGSRSQLLWSCGTLQWNAWTLVECGGWTFVTAVKHREIILHSRMNSDTAKAVVTMGSKILRMVLHFCTTKSFVDLLGIMPTYFKHNKISESETTFRLYILYHGFS